MAVRVDPDDPVARLTTILDAVRTALSTADYGALEALTTAMAEELARLEQSRSGTGLIRLQRKAERNAACLLAAQRGLKSARRRIEDIRSARSGLVTYDNAGRRSAPGPGGQITRRV